LDRIDAIFIPGPRMCLDVMKGLRERLRKRGAALPRLPVFFDNDLEELSGEINRIHQTRRQ
jgi:hypothetical protein